MSLVTNSVISSLNSQRVWVLQRMRELAIQSANGNCSDADRATLDTEFQQLKAEFETLERQTEGHQ